MRRLSQAAALLSLPPTMAHEATHYAVASLGTDDAQFAVEVTGGRALAVWPPLDNPLLRVFAFLGPTVLGTMLVALWFVTGASIEGWRLILLIGLGMYTVPSTADVRGALGRQDAQQQTE